MLKPIECQRCNGAKQSCSVCGGYGIVYEVLRCDNCGREYYSRPGAYTLYDGKKFITMDGLEITYYCNKNGCKTTCRFCEQREKTQKSLQEVMLYASYRKA